MSTLINVIFGAMCVLGIIAGVATKNWTAAIWAFTALVCRCHIAFLESLR